jgi:hypothetical protein
MAAAAGESLFGIELFLWDALIMPFFMASIGSCSKDFVSFCRLLKTPV